MSSHYLDHLNSVDGSDGYQSVDEQKLQDDLSIFANTQFFNFDIGTSTDIRQSVDDLLMQQEAHVQHVKKELIDVHALDEFSVVGSSSASASSTPVQGSSGGSFSSNLFEQRQQAGSKNESPLSRVTDGEGQEGHARKAAEEDKRRRNTAASARFRIKKKLREQQMEERARELQEKVTTLEMRIMQLEMENKWLKNLVVEKNDARDASQLMTMKKKVLESSEK